MRRLSLHRETAFSLNDVARQLRTLADQRVRQFGLTRAQWAVLARLELREGLKQSELAGCLDLKPITLTRLIDRLCTNGLIERRPDPNDRRAKRLFLTPRARPLMDRLDALGDELMNMALAGMSRPAIELMLHQLTLAKDNLRKAIQQKAPAEPEPVVEVAARRYG